MTYTDTTPAIGADRVESIIHDWMCGCGKGQDCETRSDAWEAAQQILNELAASPYVVRHDG